MCVREKFRMSAKVTEWARAAAFSGLASRAAAFSGLASSPSLSFFESRIYIEN